MKLDLADYKTRVLTPGVLAFERDHRLPDLFARYDLSLDAANEVEIEERIRSVQAFWNKEKSNTKFRALLEVLLSPAEALRSRALIEAKGRALARDAALAERKELSKLQYEELDRTLAMIAGKGHVTPDERALLIARFEKRGLAGADIAARIRVPVRESRPLLPDEKDLLPTSVRKQIRSGLAILGKRDLYAFLDLAGPAGRTEIEAQWRRKDAEWNPRGADSYKAAAKQLLGIAKEHLLDGDPAKYERSRQWEVAEMLDREVEMAGADGTIDAEELRTLVELGGKHGLTAETAREFVQGLARRRKLAIAMPPSEPTVRCASCFSMQPARGRERCTVCGEALWIGCPNCEQRVAAADAACGACGFSVANHARVRLEVRIAQSALEDRRWSDALAATREVERLGWHAAELRALRVQVEAGLHALREARRSWDHEVHARRLFAARALLPRLLDAAAAHRFDDGKTAADLSVELDARLGEVRRLIAQAGDHERRGRFPDAVVAYQGALDIAGDAEEARLGMARCPPEPPSDVRAALAGNQVQVHWRRSPSAGALRYLVVRGLEEAPLAPGAGVEIARTSDLVCRDGTATPGVYISYSVFSERAGALSAPAKSAGLLVALEVADLRIQAGHRIVRGSWTLDGGRSVRVRVWQREGRAPERAGDGVEVSLAGPLAFADQGVEDGKVYYYRVCVEYIAPSGKAVLTPGVVASAQPAASPLPVRHMELVPAPPRLAVRFTAPPQGIVNVYRGERPPPWPEGTAVPASALAPFGAPLPSPETGGALDSAPPRGRAFYFCATLGGDVAVIGACRALLSIPDVTEVAAETFGSVVLVRFRWPKDCTIARVCWRSDAPPAGAEDPSAEGRAVTRGEYEARGGFAIESPRKSPRHIAVFAGEGAAEQLAFSSGLGAGTRAEVRPSPLRVRYSVRRPLLQKKLVVTFTVDEVVGRLPDVVLAGRSDGMQPIPQNQGRILAVLGGASLGPEAPATLEVALSGVPLPLFIRAMFRDPSSSSLYQLVDPDPRHLEVR